jgi:TonB family protein
MTRAVLVALVAVAGGAVVGGAVVGCAHKEAAAPVAAPPVARTEPAPRREEPDEMKVSGTLGSLNDDEIAGPFQRRWEDVTRCYDDASARMQYLAGKIEVKVRVGATGDPKSAYVVSSTFGNYDAERCVLAITRALHFSKPHGGAEAEFTYPIEFRGKRPVQAWDEARVSPSVARHRKDVHECKTRSPNGLPPSLTLTVYVAPGGKVPSAGLSADAPLDDAFAVCLVGKTKLWRLDDPLGKMAKATVGVAE